MSFDRLRTRRGRQAQDERGLTLTQPSPTRGEGVLRQAQDARGRWAQDERGLTLTQPSPIKGEGSRIQHG